MHYSATFSHFSFSPFFLVTLCYPQRKLIGFKIKPSMEEKYCINIFLILMAQALEFFFLR